VRRVVLLVIASGLLAGCGSDEGTVGVGALRTVVLQQADLPAGYRRIDVGELTDAGWYAHYAGHLDVVSRAVVFSSSGGATEGLDRERELLTASREEWQPIDEPGLGSESFAATVVAAGVRHYRVAWRRSNVAAALWVSGPTTGLPLGDVLALARAQDEHIADAD
jgi:hypothetical protein